MRARGRCRHGWKSTECCEPAICVVSKRDISLHNIQRNIWKIQDGGCWHVRFVAFVTILLNRHHRSRRFIYFKALFSCKKHQGKIYKTQRVLVANLATNFWIFVTSTIILVALATVLGTIPYPVYKLNRIRNYLIPLTVFLKASILLCSSALSSSLWMSFTFVNSSKDTRFSSLCCSFSWERSLPHSSLKYIILSITENDNFSSWGFPKKSFLHWLKHSVIRWWKHITRLQHHKFILL